ncbi:MAG: hypothetical protein J3K34DRAFT_294346 [Monoraphidium minutum]|nr:MAG: hypothetical protein J3K34DRAFT_294346 [Monoraphidium minutum]
MAPLALASSRPIATFASIQAPRRAAQLASASAPAPLARRAAPQRGRAAAVRVCASANRDGLGALREDVARFVARYDPVATGLGSLCVCGCCVVVGGQSPGEALQVAGFATVVGMVRGALTRSHGRAPRARSRAPRMRACVQYVSFSKVERCAMCVVLWAWRAVCLVARARDGVARRLSAAAAH